MKLLLAEDEKELSNAICAVLEHNGYTVDVVDNGEDGYLLAKSNEYDAIILDVMMPKKSGFDVIKELRSEHCMVPILLLTAKSQVEDKIYGLDLGADDYVTKPFAMGELLARLRAMTRRKEYEVSNYQFFDITLDRKTCELFTKKDRIGLGNKEFQIMELLMEHPKMIVSAETLLERVWGYDTDAEINVIWVYLSNLRRKLETIESKVQIKAIRGLGYRLEKNND